MKIVIAPDSYKGSLTAMEVSDAVERGLLRVDRDLKIIKVPMADGGEGTVQSLVDATGGEIIKVRVKGPLMKDVEAFYGILGDGRTAVIEMAAASGLMLLGKNERNPMKTTTYGTGQLIKYALDRGCKKIIIGIGGSATNDGGAGMAEALGVRLLDRDQKPVGFGGGNLGRLRTIDISRIDQRIKECEVIAACDVNNSLCGLTGASCIFGPQKGANDEMVEILDENLNNYGNILNNMFGMNIKDMKGAGAAGGLGAGLVAFTGAILKKGVDIVTDTVKLEDKLKDADLVITGEGMMDFQTLFGKTPFGVLSLALKYKVPVIGICGSIGPGAEKLYDSGFTSIFSIMDRPMNYRDAVRNCAALVEKTAERIMRLIKIKI